MLSNNKKIKADMVAVVNSLTDEELRGILEMERELFPESLQDFSYEKEMSAGKTAVVAYCPEGEVAGYIFSVPHHEALAQLKDIDPNMPEVSDAHYIESIAIRSDLQGKGYFGKLMQKFKEATGGRPITMHARVCNNCSAAMKKHGAVHSHTVSNWFDSGEDFDYLEIGRK